MKKVLFSIFIFALSLTLFSFEEKDSIIRDNAKKLNNVYNFELNNWKVKFGDNKAFAQVSFNDSKWDSVAIGKPLAKGRSVSGRNGPIVWYRKEFTLDKKLPNLLWFELGYISAGNTVYINGQEIASTPHRGATFNYRRYLIKNAPFTVGKNLLAIRVQLGFMKGLYHGTPALYEAEIPQVIALLVHKNPYKNQLKRQISINEKINTFSPQETIAIQPKLYVTGNKEVEGKVIYAINGIKRETKKVLKPKKYTYFDSIEFPAQKVGKHKIKFTIYLNNQLFSTKEISFKVEEPTKFTIPKNSLSNKSCKIPLNTHSVGSNGPRYLYKRTILAEKENLSEIRGAAAGALGVSLKHNGVLPLFTNVDTTKGKWQLKDWDNNLGARYDGLTTIRPLGIVELEDEKLTSFKSISSTWTSRTYQLNYRNNSLTCTINQLAPGWLIKSKSNNLRLFRPVKDLLYGPPTKIYTPNNCSLENLTKNYFIASWEKSKNFQDVQFPVVVILQHKPKSISLDKKGILLNFEKEVGKVFLVPLYGVKPIATTSLTKADLLQGEYIAKLVPGLPTNVKRFISVDWSKDSFYVKEDFTHLPWQDDWATSIKKYSPISPSFVLSSASNLIKLSNNKIVLDCNYSLNAGPLCVVPGATHTTQINNLTKFVREERALCSKTFDKKLAAKLESLVLKQLPQLEKHPWANFNAKNSNVTVGGLEPEFTNLLLTLPFLSPKNNKRLINAINKEASLTFTNDNLLVNGKRRKKKTPITSHLTNSVTKLVLAAPYIHSHQGGIDGPCWIGNQISLLWNYAYYCNKLDFLKAKIDCFERYINTLINSNDWSYSVTYDSHSGIRVGNGLQESTIFYAAFASAAKFYHFIGNYQKRDQMAALSMLHLVGISSVVSSQTAKYLRENRPYLATCPDAPFIERDERLLPNHFFEFNERGGLFHSIMRGGSEPLFSNNWIMTQTPNVMRPFKHLWTQTTNEHYRPTLSNWQFELPVPVDTYLYMTSNPPFPIKDHYKVRMAFPLKENSRIADIRAYLEYQTKTKWVKLW